MTLGRRLVRMIRRARRRLWARRLVRWSTLLLSVSLGVGAVLFLMHGLLGVGCVWCWCLVALPWVAGGIVAWPWKLPPIEIVKAIDLANGLDERLSSAWDFLSRKEPTPWMQAHLKATADRLDDMAERDFGRRTFPIEKPGHWFYVGATALFLVASVGGLRLIDRYEADKAVSTLPPDAVEQAAARSNLDEVSLALREEQARSLQELAKALDDPVLKEAADMLAQILADEAQGKLSAEEFEARLAALEAMLEKSAPASREEQQKFDEIIKNAVQELTQMKEDPDTRELAQALEESNYDKAADILKSLLDSVDPKDQKKLEKLAKMFADLARKLDLTDPELKAAIQKNRDLVERLKEQFEKTNKLTNEEKRAFDEASKRLEEDQQRAEAQKSADKTSQALDKLQKAFDKTSQDMGSKAQKAKEPSGSPQEAAGQEQSGPPQEVPGGDEQAQSQVRPDADAQEPSGQSPGTDAQKPSGTPSEGSEQMGAEEALREEAKQRSAQDAHEAMRDMAEKMRRDAEDHKGREKDDEKSKERSENMEDFLERASGGQKQQSPQPSPDSEQGQKSQQSGESGQEQQSGESGQEQQSGKSGQEQQGAQEQSQSQQGNQSGQEQQGGQEQSQEQQSGQSGQNQQGGQEQSQEQQGAQGQQSGKQPGQEDGNSQGDARTGMGTGTGHQGGHDPSEGPATDLDARTRDERLEGMQGAAPTTSEVIRQASQSGFVTESYKEVFQTYERAAEDVLEQEQVPQGYRQYVERYFEMIRPK